MVVAHFAAPFVVLLSRQRAQPFRGTREHSADVRAPTAQVTQRAERVVHDLAAVGAEEDQVAGLRAGALDDHLEHRGPLANPASGQRAKAGEDFAELAAEGGVAVVLTSTGVLFSAGAFTDTAGFRRSTVFLPSPA